MMVTALELRHVTQQRLPSRKQGGKLLKWCIVLRMAEAKLAPIRSHESVWPLDLGTAFILPCGRPLWVLCMCMPTILGLRRYCLKQQLQTISATESFQKHSLPRSQSFLLIQPIPSTMGLSRTSYENILWLTYYVNERAQEPACLRSS